MCKILCVDDSVTNVEVLSHYLELAGGHEVDVARSGAEAQTKLLAGRYDVLIFDYVIRDIDGLNLLRWTRGAGVPTPCLLHSAIDPLDLRAVEAIASAERLGPMATLPKITNPLSLILDVITDLAEGVVK